jgi:BirA family biotin operon repressor/biotin-[acetyl-CoA-carboxylase] ligase
VAPPRPRDPLDATRLRAALEPRWARVDVVAATGSTNADLLADGAAPDRSLLVAEHQIAGRGRLDRTWTSPAGAGLTFSALFRPRVPVVQWSWVPLLAGVALAEAVRAHTGVDAVLKWPNDLLVADGGKLAGVLVQTAGDVVVVGIGLNVDLDGDELPAPAATSLRLAGAGPADRTALLVDIARALDTRVAHWAENAGDAEASGLARSYRSLCTTLGREVRVELAGDAVVTGEAIDVDAAGRLVVRDNLAGARSIGAGDVAHVRPSRR